MNGKMSNVFNTTKVFIKKHSPEILTGIGITGMITSTVLAVKATPKALILIEDAKDVKNDELTTLETIKVAWKPYIPAVVTGIASTACIIGASTVNYKRNAALATAYAISEKTLLTYKDKVIETIGEKKEKEIRDKISQDEVNKKPTGSSQVIITQKGNTLFMDPITRRYFRSDLATIKNIVNKLNREMTYQNYISLNSFYNEIGLEPISTGNDLGWNLDGGLIDIDYDTCLADNDEPCIVLDHMIPPRYDFDKFA